MVHAGQYSEKAAMIYLLPMTGDSRKLLPVSMSPYVMLVMERVTRIELVLGLGNDGAWAAA